MPTPPTISRAKASPDDHPQDTRPPARYPCGQSDTPTEEEYIKRQRDALRKAYADVDEMPTLRAELKQVKVRLAIEVEDNTRVRRDAEERRERDKQRIATAHERVEALQKSISENTKTGCDQSGEKHKQNDKSRKQSRPAAFGRRGELERREEELCAEWFQKRLEAKIQENKELQARLAGAELQVQITKNVRQSARQDVEDQDARIWRLIQENKLLEERAEKAEQGERR